MKIGFGLGLDVSNKNPKGGNDPAVDALLAQATTDGATPMSGDNIKYSNTLVTSLKSAGIWDKLDALYIFATNGDEQFARYNWIDPSTFKCTEVGAGALTFTSNEGFTGDGTNYLDPSFTALVSGSNYTQNSASFGVLNRSDIVDNTNFGEIGNEAGARNLLWIRKGVYIKGKINSFTSLDSTTLPANVNGFYQVNRASSTTFKIFKDGSQLGGDLSGTSTGGGSDSILIFKSAPTLPSRKQLSIAYIGGDLESEASDFYNAVNTYMNSIGSPI